MFRGLTIKKKLISLLLALVIVPCSLFSGCFNKDDVDISQYPQGDFDDLINYIKNINI